MLEAFWGRELPADWAERVRALTLEAFATELRPVPDWGVVHRELRRPNVTLSLLWEEYRGGTGSTGPLCGSCRRHLMNMPTGSAAG